DYDLKCCGCTKPKIYENLCDSPYNWYDNAQCYTAQKLNQVTWYKACPKGRVLRPSSDNYLLLTAKYIGPGRNYDPSYKYYASGGLDTGNIWLQCVHTR